MWYAVETAFVNGKHLASKPAFDPKYDGPDRRRTVPGTCWARHNEQPMNSTQTFLDGLIEIHTDWFQTKEQAIQFVSGKLTYVIHLDVEYRKDINSHVPHFRKWETVPVDDKHPPFRGIYEKHNY